MAAVSPFSKGLILQFFSQVHLQVKTGERIHVHHSPPLAEHTLVAVCTECTRQSPLLLRLLRTRTSPPPLTTEGGVPPLPLSKGTPPPSVHPSFSPFRMSTSQVASDCRESKRFLGRGGSPPLNTTPLIGEVIWTKSKRTATFFS